MQHVASPADEIYEVIDHRQIDGTKATHCAFLGLCKCGRRLGAPPLISPARGSVAHALHDRTPIRIQLLSALNCLGLRR